MISVDRDILINIGGFLVAYNLLGRAYAALSAKYSTTYKELSPFDKTGWTGRLVSLTHAPIAVALAWRCLRDYECWTCAATLIHAHDSKGVFALAHTGGYLLHDFVDLLINGRKHKKYDGGPLVFLHHVAAICSYCIVASYRKCTLLYVIWILCELSTPFLNGIWFFSKMKLKPQRTVCGLMLFLSYVPTRIYASPATAAACRARRREGTAAFLVGFLLAMLGFATVMPHGLQDLARLPRRRPRRGEDEEGGVTDVLQAIIFPPYVYERAGCASCAQGTLPYQYSTRYLLWCEALGQCGGLPSHADDASQLQRCPPNHHHPCPSPRNP